MNDENNTLAPFYSTIGHVLSSRQPPIEEGNICSINRWAKSVAPAIASCWDEPDSGAVRFRLLLSTFGCKMDQVEQLLRKRPRSHSCAAEKPSVISRVRHILLHGEPVAGVPREFSTRSTSATFYMDPYSSAGANNYRSRNSAHSSLSFYPSR